MRAIGIQSCGIAPEGSARDGDTAPEEASRVLRRLAWLAEIEDEEDIIVPRPVYVWHYWIRLRKATEVIHDELWKAMVVQLGGIG